MDQNDQQAIRQLFGRLSDVERQAPPRDAEAEAFIHRQIVEQPGAPYYMAQTIIVQEQALQRAERRRAELAAQAAQPAGGLFGGLFGGGSSRSSVPRTGPAVARGQGAAPPPQQGGGFLAGAAQTAMGVAGGLLLGNAIAGMFSGGEASAAEPGAGMEDTGEDPGAFDDGGDFGDFGDMDF